jgi:hypothetical protein
VVDTRELCYVMPLHFLEGLSKTVIKVRIACFLHGFESCASGMRVVCSSHYSVKFIVDIISTERTGVAVTLSTFILEVPHSNISRTINHSDKQSTQTFRGFPQSLQVNAGNSSLK